MDINNNCNNSNLMEFILSFITLIKDFCLNNNIAKDKKIFVVIDDYNEDLYDKEGVIEKIKDFVNKSKDKFRLCILGNGKFINEKMYKYFSNKAEDFVGIYWNYSINNKDASKNKILKIPKYYYKYKESKNLNEDENKVKEEITEKFKLIDLSSFLFLSKHMNSFINLEFFKDDFIKLPLEYLTIQKITDEGGNVTINLSFNSEIYNEVFEESIKGLLKIESLKTKHIIFNDEKQKGKDGIDFEDLIVEQLWNNTFEYIQFPNSNKLKVENIYDLKDYKNINKNDENNKKEKNDDYEKEAQEKRETNVNINEPIIIKQSNFKGIL